MPAISAVVAMTFVTHNDGDIIPAVDWNNGFNSTKSRISDLNTIVADLEKNDASTTEPTDKPEGKIWCDTTNDPAQLYFYNDGVATKSELVSRTATQTLTNKTLTAPKFADLGFIADANGNELLILDTVASAVNELTLANAATAADPSFTASGETNVGVIIAGKGTGNLKLQTNGSTRYQIDDKGAITQISRNENLKLAQTSVTQVTLTGAANCFLTLYDTNDRGIVLNFTANIVPAITASGVNGLDTGAEAASTWYHIWAIYDGTTKALLFSTSATAPTMPSGYTYKKYIGAVYNSAASNFVAFAQKGNLVVCPATDVVVGTDTTYTNVSLTAVVPTTASSVSGYIGGSNGTAEITKFSFASDTTGLGEQNFRMDIVSVGTSHYIPLAPLALFTAQQIAYLVAGASTPNADLFVSGWNYPDVV